MEVKISTEISECHGLHHFGFKLTGAIENKRKDGHTHSKAGLGWPLLADGDPQQLGNSTPLFYAAEGEKGTNLGRRSP